MRWVVPANMGASMPAGLMLRNRIINGFIADNQVLTISREGLAKTGPVVATITCRAVEPLPASFAGVIIRLDGSDPHDKTPVDDPTINPLSSGIPNFDFYSLEVVQRIGYDSFCPDNGVLLAKNKDKESRNGGPNGYNCFTWVIDAHPENINKVDYVRVDGTPVMRTIADYRQLNDALFHSGNISGSLYEWEDVPNRLHFYIIDLKKNEDGILTYKIGIMSLDGSGSQKRGIGIVPPSSFRMKNQAEYCVFNITNTGEPSVKDTTQPDKTISAVLGYDIYRLSVSITGKGWNSQIMNSLASVKPGNSEKVPVYISCEKGSSSSAIVTFTARSESDPSKIVSSSYKIKAPSEKR
jgi:hypothetical protein